MNDFDLTPIIDIIKNGKEAWLIIFGAFVSAAISTFFSRRREKQLLVKDLQAKASNDLLTDIERFFNISNSIMFPSFLFFGNYNSVIATCKPIDPSQLDNYNKYLNEFIHNRIENSKELARNDYNKYNESWQKYCETFFKVIYKLEANEVIFNRFTGIKNLMLDEFVTLSEMHQEFVDLYFDQIANNITNSRSIDEEVLKRVDNFRDAFMKKCLDINTIIYDLRIGLQNEFLGELFKYKVPERQPKDPSFQVYRPGFVYERKKGL